MHVGTIAWLLHINPRQSSERHNDRYNNPSHTSNRVTKSSGGYLVYQFFNLLPFSLTHICSHHYCNH